MASRSKKAKTITERKVGKVRHEFKQGSLRSGGTGRKVRSRTQAIAIGLSEARAAGARVPRKKAARKTRTKSKRA